MDPLSRPVLEFGSPEEKDSLRKQVLELWSPAAEETQRRRSSSHLAAVSSLSHLTMMLAGGESDVGGLPPNLHLSDAGKVLMDPLRRVLELGAIDTKDVRDHPTCTWRALGQAFLSKFRGTKNSDNLYTANKFDQDRRCQHSYT